MPEGSPLEWQRRGLILGGTETLPSIYAKNQQKPKWFLHHSFTSQMCNTHHLTCTSEGNSTPPLPTINVACSVTHLHYIHGGLGLRLILQRCTWKFPAFLGPCRNSQWFQTRASVSTDTEAQVQVLERGEKERQRLRLPFKKVLATTSAFTMKATLRKGWGDRGGQEEPPSLPQHLDRC